MGLRIKGHIYEMRSQLDPERLVEHLGHNVKIVAYSADSDSAPVDVALECEDCGEVLADCER